MGCRYRAAFSLYLFFLVIFCAPAYSQESNSSFRVQSATQFVHNNQLLNIWGVLPLGEENNISALKGRIALDDFIQRKPVSCNIQPSNNEIVSAQCSNFD